MRRGVMSGALATAILLLAGLAETADQSLSGLKDRVGNLTQVYIVVENLHPEAVQMGLTEQFLEGELFVQLRASLPRLKVERGPLAELVYLRVTVRGSKFGGQVIGYFGSVELQLVRYVTILAT